MFVSCSRNFFSYNIHIRISTKYSYFSHFKTSFFCFFPKNSGTSERSLRWLFAKMDDSHYPEESYQEECCIILKTTQEACHWIAEKYYLQPFKKDINTIKIPINIVRNRILITVGARMFFCHMYHSIISLLFLQFHAEKKEMTKERISVLNMLICRQDL